MGRSRSPESHSPLQILILHVSRPDPQKTPVQVLPQSSASASPPNPSLEPVPSCRGTFLLWPQTVSILSPLPSPPTSITAATTVRRVFVVDQTLLKARPCSPGPKGYESQDARLSTPDHHAREIKASEEEVTRHVDNQLPSDPRSLQGPRPWLTDRGQDPPYPLNMGEGKKGEMGSRRLNVAGFHTPQVLESCVFLFSGRGFSAWWLTLFCG
ncbi:hypothetical protein D9613_003733 [Agrocybe pediades]|uniref:Uncharacterized protein n=1 Tax=Agrocybe pediades TaxID=84607 RepID=A0A8H4VJH0_9AGAR|nr:hypothetical protein D9613_003733 [Agrocybe pediades]